VFDGQKKQLCNEYWQIKPACANDITQLLSQYPPLATSSASVSSGYRDAMVDNDTVPDDQLVLVASVLLFLNG
jgi:hypothetical protein